jgi:hypothetical protein
MFWGYVVINQTVLPKLSHRNRTYNFTVNLKLQPDGPAIHSELVLPEDLIGIYSEVWLSAYLRKGRPEIGFNDLAYRLLPEFSNGSRHRCGRLVVESKQSDGRIAHSPNGVEALRTVAERGAKGLLEKGILVFGQPYFYEVIAGEGVQGKDAMGQNAPVKSAPSKIKYTPLIYREVSISPLIKRAAAVGAVDEGMPIFFKKHTYTKAERFSRKGARYNPPAESGAVVLGWLGACPDTGEFFVVATEVIELVDTLQNKISLTYTDKTWANIQTVLRERQSTPATRAERIVGQSHGHNFLPCFGKKECHQCEEQQQCAATSVFVSENDLLWSRCVFSRQPWAFCQIFGLDARGTRVQQMYGFRLGRLVKRGFYVIP